jgi:hypothetical protein
MSHFSSILHDNEASNVNEMVMDMLYDNELHSVSLLALDNVAKNGNAILSVLRNACGQSIITDTDQCGAALPKPNVRYRNSLANPQLWMGVCVALYAAWLLYSAVQWQRPKLLYTAYARLVHAVVHTEWRNRHSTMDEATKEVDRSRRTELLPE